ncbi:hypothetical protein CAAN1_21S02014 [[Candida] anglica]|uniref:DUF1746 domain-containing protein n=1 Tax=[Candida] anglica TaxID=148631 RepID=A0ABP0EGU1_9ASCO
MTLQDEVNSFTEMRYPPASEIIVNNASVLYKRKKYFLEDIRRICHVMGFVIIAIVYLRDLSFLRFVVRALTQYFISNPYSKMNERMVIPDEIKRIRAKALLIGILGSNTFCILTHLLFGVYTKSPSDRDIVTGGTGGAAGYLYGSMTVQFIGESLPFSRFELILMDLVILLIQVTYHSLMCVIDVSSVLEPKRDLLDEGNASYEADGYGGNVDLVDIDVIANVRLVLGYSDRAEMPPQLVEFWWGRQGRQQRESGEVLGTNTPAAPQRIPGSFPTSSVFV